MIFVKNVYLHTTRRELNIKYFNNLLLNKQIKIKPLNLFVLKYEKISQIPIVLFNFFFFFNKFIKLFTNSYEYFFQTLITLNISEVFLKIPAYILHNTPAFIKLNDFKFNTTPLALKQNIFNNQYSKLFLSFLKSLNLNSLHNFNKLKPLLFKKFKNNFLNSSYKDVNNKFNCDRFNFLNISLFDSYYSKLFKYKSMITPTISIKRLEKIRFFQEPDLLLLNKVVNYSTNLKIMLLKLFFVSKFFNYYFVIRLQNNFNNSILNNFISLINMFFKINCFILKNFNFEKLNICIHYINGLLHNDLFDYLNLTNSKFIIKNQSPNIMYNQESDDKENLFISEYYEDFDLNINNSLIHFIIKSHKNSNFFKKISNFTNIKTLKQNSYLINNNYLWLRVKKNHLNINNVYGVIYTFVKKTYLTKIGGFLGLNLHYQLQNKLFGIEDLDNMSSFNWMVKYLKWKNNLLIQPWDRTFITEKYSYILYFNMFNLLYSNVNNKYSNFNLIKTNHIQSVGFNQIKIRIFVIGLIKLVFFKKIFTLMQNNSVFNLNFFFWFKKLLIFKFMSNKLLHQLVSYNDTRMSSPLLGLLPIESVWLTSFFFKSYYPTSNYQSSSLVNEHSHLVSFNRVLQKHILSKVLINITPDYFRFYYNAFFKFLEYKMTKKILVNYRNKMILNEKPYLRSIINKYYKKYFYIQRRMGKGFFVNEMIEIFYLSFLFKDILLISNWISRTIDRLNFRHHKKFVRTIKFILKDLFYFFFTSNNIYGFFYDLRGKVGVRGNARKRHVIISLGKNTRTSKKFRYCYDFRVIRTDTGSMGMHTMMLY